MTKKSKSSKKKARKKEEYLTSIVSTGSSQGNKKSWSKKFSLNELTPSYTKKSKSKTRAGKKVSAFPKPEEEEDFVPVTARQMKDRDKVEKRESKVVLDTPDFESLNKKIVPIIIGGLIIIVLVLGLVAILSVTFNYFNNMERQLETNENIENAFVKGETIYVKLADSDLSRVKKIKFIFLGDKEYYFEESRIAPSYEFKASDMGIKNLGELEKVSAVFIYQ